MNGCTPHHTHTYLNCIEWMASDHRANAAEATGYEIFDGALVIVRHLLVFFFWIVCSFLCQQMNSCPRLSSAREYLSNRHKLYRTCILWWWQWQPNWPLAPSQGISGAAIELLSVRIAASSNRVDDGCVQLAIRRSSDHSNFLDSNENPEKKCREISATERPSEVVDVVVRCCINKNWLVWMNGRTTHTCELQHAHMHGTGL